MNMIQSGVPLKRVTKLAVAKVSYPSRIPAYAYIHYWVCNLRSRIFVWMFGKDPEIEHEYRGQFEYLSLNEFI